MVGSLVFNQFVNSLLNLHGWQAYLLVGALCFGEVALFIGFVLPGEIAVIYGGVLSSRHETNIVAMTALVVACAVFGNLVGYAVGKWLGPFFLRHRPLKGREAVEKSRVAVKNRGALAVFIGRFVAVARAFIPAVAGMAEVELRGFVIASVAGGVLWGIGYCLAGFLAGVSYAKVVSVAGRASAFVLVGVVVALVALFFHRHTARRRRLP